MLVKKGIMGRLLLLVFGYVLLTGDLFAQESKEYLQSRLVAAEAHQLQRTAQLSSMQSPGQEGFDVTYYKLNLKLSLNPNNLGGSVTMVAKAIVNNLTLITLDLMDALKVDSVLSGGVRIANVTQQPALISIPLDRPYNVGEFFTVVVYYHGVPGSSGFGSFDFGSTSSGSPWIWSLSEPYGAKDWWPCKDTPGDKADSLDVWLTCDSRFKVGSEGLLVATVDNGDGTKAYKWKHRYPSRPTSFPLPWRNTQKQQGGSNTRRRTRCRCWTMHSPRVKVVQISRMRQAPWGSHSPSFRSTLICSDCILSSGKSTALHDSDGAGEWNTGP